MVVQHNLTAMNSSRNLGIVTGQQAKQSEKLSSGYRINRAADDAAGLTISEKMRAQIRGLAKASDNAQDGVSLIQVAEGALNETHAILQRMNELATQAANDTNTSIDREAISAEIEELKTEVTRIASTTEFNSQKILDGTFETNGLKLQVGDKNEAAQSIEVKIGSMATSAFTGLEDIKVSSHTDATAAMETIQNAINDVSTQRSKLGAIQNRLEHTIKNLDNIHENTQAAESRLRDTDMAEAMVDYSKNQILAQAGQSMLAQANQSTQGVLSLLQ